MKKHISFIFLNSAVIIFLVLILSGCGNDSYVPVSSQMKADLSVLPEEGSGIVYVNFNQLFNSPASELFTKKMKLEISENQEYKKFVEVTGFDLMKDVSRGYFILEGVEKYDKALFLGMAKGTFPQEKIKNYTKSQDKENKIKSYKYKDVTIYLADEEIAFVFADNSTLFMGNKGNVEKALDLFNEPDVSSTYWIEKIQKVKYKEGFFVVAETGEMIEQLANDYEGHQLNGGLGAIKSLENIHFSFDAREDIKFDGRGYFNNLEKAELFFDATKGAWSAAKLAISDNRDAVNIANKVKFNLDEKEVKVSGEMTVDEAKKLLQQADFLPVKLNSIKKKSHI